MWGGGVNLVSSTPSGAESKEVVSADYVAEKADSRIENKFNQSVTNCITEIPQDIKYEIFDEGEVKLLKILAGTKYWVPNGLETDGTKKFRYGVLTDDLISPNEFWSDNDADIEQAYLLFKDDKITVNTDARIGSNVSSGETAPTIFIYNKALWYDTKENYIKFTSDSGATWAHCSFPLLSGQPKITYGWTQGVTQVYNGFGFIGSTIYALPGVKGLIPDGRNEDGSLKNKEYNATSVITYTSDPSERGEILLTQDGEFRWIATSRKYYEQYNQPFNPAENIYGTWYNPENNTMKISWNNQAWHQVWWFHVGSVNGSQSIFTVLKPKQAFRAIDYYDKPMLAGVGMPANKYLDLTLGASGSTYTAPANGWFYLKKAVSSDAKQYCAFVVNGDVYQIGSAPTGSNSTFLFAPVQSGQQIKVDYTAAGETSYFRFIYAEGEQ